MRLFKKKSEVKPILSKKITGKRNWPTGTFVETERGTYYIKGHSRFKLISERALDSWYVIPVLADYESVKHLTFGGYLGFRDGTLIKDVSTGKTYLIAANKRWHITSPDVFDNFGLYAGNVVEVSDKEANAHQDGGVLSVS